MKSIKPLLIITFISLNKLLFSQEVSCHEILPKFDLLEFSLIKKDTIALNDLLHEKLTFGHSNGWIETKESLLNSLPTSKVVYKQIVPHGKVKAEFIHDNLVTLRREQIVIGEYEGQPFDVDLKILEVWVGEGSKWMLIARQSIEVDFDRLQQKE